jgi:spore coat protein A
MFENDLPVIRDLGLRVKLSKGKRGAKNIEVSMEETFQDVLGMGFDTRVWGYRFPGLPATYPGATIIANRDKPLTIKWTNNLPGHFLPVDASLHMAHPSDVHGVDAVRAWYDEGNVPTVAHLHGGHTESASDGLPEAWFTQDFDETGNFFVTQDYTYHNDQEAATLWYHDHALGITRLNVYAGLAGFYLLRDDNEEMLIETNVLPEEEYEIEIVIQDRMFDMDGQLFWPAYEGEVPYDDFITGEGAVLPPEVFPDNGGPTALAEYFGNIILVNGKAWPKLDVEPRKYRFRLLNGSDSRFYILKLDNGTGAGSDNMMVIGTDNGLLESPVLVNELAMAPGERYDVVVDFSAYVPNADPLLAPKITVTNWGADGPAAGGVIDPGDIACTETTGKIMQFQVTKALDNTNPAASVALGTALRAPINPLTTNAPSRQLVLFEGMDEFGRLQPMLGTMDIGSQTWFEPITENPALNAVEEWEVYNATGDAHPIHLHLVTFQIQNRESFVGGVTPRPQIQHNSIPGDFSTYGTGGVLTVNALVGDITAPLPYELGWKDTFIVPPGQVGRVRAKFDRPGRYVWHCHILSHEDHEMMRPFHVGPLPAPPPPALKAAAAGDPVLQTEFRLFPNPASEMITVDLLLEEGADVSISIYGLEGRMINSEKLGYLNDGLQSIAVPVGHLDNGMYILELKAGSKQFRESIIISK